VTTEEHRPSVDGLCVSGESDYEWTKWSEESVNVKDYRLGGWQWRNLTGHLGLENPVHKQMHSDFL